MIHAFFKEFLDYPVLYRFPESNHNFVCGFILGSEGMDAKVVTVEGVVPKVVMKAEGAALEVTKVLVPRFTSG